MYGTDQPALSFSEVISHVVASQGRPCPNNAHVEQAERHLDACNSESGHTGKWVQL